jgi:hypothetical protein
MNVIAKASFADESSVPSGQFRRRRSVVRREKIGPCKVAE